MRARGEVRMRWHSPLQLVDILHWQDEQGQTGSEGGSESHEDANGEPDLPQASIARSDPVEYAVERRGVEAYVEDGYVTTK